MAEATLLGQNSGSNSGSSDNESIYERPISFDFEDIPYKRNITVTGSSFTFDSSSYTKIASFTYNSSETVNNQNDHLYFYINGSFSIEYDGGENVKLYYKATTSSSYTHIQTKSYDSWNSFPIFSITKSSLKNGTTYEFFVQSTCSEYGCDISLSLRNIEYWYNITQIALTSKISSGSTVTFNGEGYYKFYYKQLGSGTRDHNYSSLKIGSNDVQEVPNESVIYVPSGQQKLTYSLKAGNGDTWLPGYIFIYKTNKKNSDTTEKVIKNSIKKKHYISYEFTSYEFVPFDYYIDIDKIINLCDHQLICPTGIVVSTSNSPIEFLELN